MSEAFFPACESSDWQTMSMLDGPSFDRQIGAFEFRKTGATTAQARFVTDRHSQNIQCGLHGGYLAARAEQVFYLPLYTAGSVALGRVVTIDFSMQYLQGGTPGSALLADVELLKETGRLGFIRGTLSQQGKCLCSFSATLRKVAPQA